MRRHAFDPISAALGAVTAALGLVFLLGQPNAFHWRWSVTWPVTLIVVGGLIAAFSLASVLGRRPRAIDPDVPSTPTGAPTELEPAPGEQEDAEEEPPDRY